MTLPDSSVQSETNQVLHPYTSLCIDTSMALSCKRDLVIKLHMSCVVLQVYHVRNKMDKVGLDMMLDIHGDEELPYNFINGNEVRQAPCCD